MQWNLRSLARVLLVLLTTTSCSASAGPVGTAAPVPGPSATAALPDFDGDGAADLVVGVGASTAVVSVRYGGGRSQDISRADLDGSESYGFGQSLLSGDLNGDGYTDLVVEDADESFGQVPALFLLPGSAEGLKTADASLHPVPDGLPPGGALALVGGPEPQLVVAAGDPGGITGGGLLVYSIGVDGRLGAEPAMITQDSPGIPGTGAPGDRFGASLAASGELLFVGAPGKDVGGMTDAGVVFVLTRAGNRAWRGTSYTQASAGVPGDPEPGEGFGSSLAAGLGFLAVGAPLDRGAHGQTGTVQPFRIVGTGLESMAALSVGTPEVPGEPVAGDRFGAAIAIARLCAGVPGILVGAPGSGLGAGAAWAVPLTEGCRSTPLAESAAGPDGPGRGLAQFGSGVSALRIGVDGPDTLVIAAEGTSEEGVYGRVLTLRSPYAGPAEVRLEELVLGDDRGLALSPAGD